MIEVLIIKSDFLSPTLSLIEYDRWRGGILCAHYHMMDQYPIPSFLRIGLSFRGKLIDVEEYFYSVWITCYFPRLDHEMAVKRYARRYRRGLYKALRRIPAAATMPSLRSDWNSFGTESKGWVP